MREDEKNKKFNTTQYLKQHCPDYKPISEAPSSPFDCDEWASLTPKEHDAFEVQFWEEEQHKIYSAMSNTDPIKTIWLIYNPAVARHFIENGVVRYRPKWQYETKSLATIKAKREHWDL